LRGVYKGFCFVWKHASSEEQSHHNIYIGEFFDFKVMDLRSLKKEVQELPSLKGTAEKFGDNWLQTIRTNTNSHLPFLQKLSLDTKKEINLKLAKAQENLNQLRSSQTVQNKLNHYSHHLIELKLSKIQGDQAKSNVITKQLLDDEYLNLRTTINEVKEVEHNIKDLEKNYEEINLLLHKELPLEEALFYMDLPHKKYLNLLLKTAEKQRSLVGQLGHNFVSISKENRRLHR
jgi:hypothetical protein